MQATPPLTPDKLLCIFVFVIFQIIVIQTATIGDGSRSIYTGNLIDPNDARGSCLADGLRFPSETSIPRDHPCHYCICYKSRVTCYWKQCSGPPLGCEVMFFENVCNPSLYICNIPDTTRNEPVAFGDRLNRFEFRKRRKRFRRDVGTLNSLPIDEGFPVEFQKAWTAFIKEKTRKRRSVDAITALESVIGDTSCTILGVRYLLGEVIGVATDVCMECRCAAERMFCSPKCCFQPSPFSITTQQERNFILKARVKGDELRSHPLHYIKNQIR